MRIVHTECPICSGKNLIPFLVCKDYTVSGEQFEIAYCQPCHTGLTQNIPDQASIGSYYKAESYISHSNTKAGLINRLYHYARNWMLRSKYDLVSKATHVHQGSLLDIGSGTGYFLDMMKKKQWQVKGIEADEDARKFAEQQFGLTIFPPSELTRLAEKQFDAITLWHVLEHLHELNGSWQQFGRLLKDAGTLFIAVPNHECYDAAHYKAQWAAYDVPRHLWHFSPTSIATLAQNHGFQIMEKKIMPFDPFYIALLSEKYAANSIGLIRGALHGGIALLRGLLNVDKSSSIIYVLKKKS
ncbi:MAG: class I SAM-dependent methyltransferase [Cytophagales bacterium]|nr:MAG: class I SAM-dependent methyltransferase [Cytophagales bacterium]